MYGFDSINKSPNTKVVSKSNVRNEPPCHPVSRVPVPPCSLLFWGTAGGDNHRIMLRVSVCASPTPSARGRVAGARSVVGGGSARGSGVGPRRPRRSDCRGRWSRLRRPSRVGVARPFPSPVPPPLPGPPASCPPPPSPLCPLRLSRRDVLQNIDRIFQYTRSTNLQVASKDSLQSMTQLGS